MQTGDIKCWGKGSDGMLGYGDTDDRGLYAEGMGDALPVVDFGGTNYAISIFFFVLVRCAVLDNAKVKCWGRNAEGAAGLERTSGWWDVENTNAPSEDVRLGTTLAVKQVAIGGGGAGYNLAALLSDGGFKAWGVNTLGELGDGDTLSRGGIANTMGSNLQSISINTEVVALEGVSGGSCARMQTGDIKCWGTNQGTLGIADNYDHGIQRMGDLLPFMQIGTSYAIDIVATTNRRCILLDNGQLKCWGNTGISGGIGYEGVRKSGLSPTTPAISTGTDLKVKHVSVSHYSTCILLSDGSVKCWGDALRASIGYGDTKVRGYEAGTMGTALPFI
ncbi:regulator of chromosome condensation 1/beta-lactamase-inhibitor protein II, partial [Baffinella frigidus]